MNQIPENMIAKYPKSKRDNCKLLVLNKNSGNIEHKKFYEIFNYIKPGDLIVLNNSKVIKARLFGKKDTGAKIEVLLLKNISKNLWKSLIKGKNIKENTKIILDKADFIVKEKCSDGTYVIEVFSDISFDEYLELYGTIPLPPYIKRNVEDIDEKYYQTVFAKEKGSVASPTASLHFTEDLLDKLSKSGVLIKYLTLHVGYGTFSVVRDIETHDIHEEEFFIDSSLESSVKDCKKRGCRVWAVGTTVVRTLESAFNENLEITKNYGYTKLFIKPGYKFKVVDAIITNFHHPETTLMLLVSAFASESFIDKAYKIAIDKNYKFLSYGDSMAIL